MENTSEQVIRDTVKKLFVEMLSNFLESFKNAEFKNIGQQFDRPPPQQAFNRFFKTKLCRFYNRPGGCYHGENCRFAHGVEELRPFKENRYHPYQRKSVPQHGIKQENASDGDDDDDDDGDV